VFDPETRRARSATSNQAFVKGRSKRGVQNKAVNLCFSQTSKSGAAALINIQLNSMLAGEEPKPRRS